MKAKVVEVAQSLGTSADSGEQEDLYALKLTGLSQMSENNTKTSVQSI